MKRKLFSVVLSTFALFLLTGAADASAPAAALLTEEGGAAPMSVAEIAATGALAAGQEAASGLLDLASQIPAAAAAQPDYTAAVQPEGTGIPAYTGIPEYPGYEDPAAQRQAQPVVSSNGLTSLTAYAQSIDPSASIAWDGQTLTITANGTTVSAASGKVYLVANGRYLYVPGGVQAADGQMYVPDAVAAKAFSGLQSGDSFYDQEALFWLSRVIYRESGNQSMEGQMAVGNVVLNRVADPAFPNTIEGVLAQKNQFSTYKSGALRKTKPSASSVIAAKLVLDGGVVEATRGATFFDSSSNSWASRNKQYIATLGGHNFYG